LGSVQEQGRAQELAQELLIRLALGSDRVTVTFADETCSPV